MKDEAKTKRQLLTELRELRQQLAESGKNKAASSDHAKLRGRAEESLKAGHTQTDQSETNDTERLSHELQVHQVELEMQNEELRNGLVQIGELHTRYSDLYDFAPVGYLTLDENGLVVEANLTISRQLGVERSRIVGSPLFVYIVKADRDALYSHFRSVFKDKAHKSCEVRFKREDGVDFHAQLDTILVEDAGGKGRFRTSVTDITEHKLAEKALADSAEKYRVLFEGSTHGILATDIDTKRFVFASPSICHMLGYSEKELLDLSVEDIHPKDSLNMVLSELEFQFMGEKKLSSAMPCLRKDGTVFFADIAGTFTSIHGRQLAVGFFSDVTERVEHTREIEHLNRLYSVLSRVSQAVVRATSHEKFLGQACREVVEGGGFLLAWTGQLDPMTGAVLPTAFGGRIGEYVKDITVYADNRPEGRGPTGTCIREGRPSVHNDFLHSPLTLPWRDRAAPFGIASCAAFPIQRAGQVWGALTIYSDEVGRFGQEDVKLLEKVAGDIEFALDNLDREFQRKFALEELNKYRDHLEELVKERTSELAISNEQLSHEIEERKRAEQALKSAAEKFKFFAYSVAHDLKSPAIGVHGLTRRLNKHSRDFLDEKGKIYCDQILKVSEHIAALADKINTYIATKEAAPLIETTNVTEILRTLKDEFSAQLSLRRIDLLAPEFAVEVDADKLLILRVFRNLIDNALKYGGESLSRISIGYEDSESLHTFSVSDNGKGLNEADAEKIFGLFQRNQTSKGVEGAGLGLAIVKEIAEQHGGRVWATPGDKRGITFYVSISKNLRAIRDAAQNTPQL